MNFQKWLCIGAALFIANFTTVFGQTDNVGSGGAIQFDGTDDYIDFGDVYSDLELPFTISAWVKLDANNNQPGPVFASRNCDPIYTGFRLIVNNNVISMDYGDGLGGNSPAFRRGKNASVDLIAGYWNHVTVVVRGHSDMSIYLNGVDVGGSYSGNSPFTMDSSKPGFGSTAYFASNGVIYRFKGMVDDIRLWNRALAEVEIRNTMCVNLTGTESGLIGYWNFNEIAGNTVLDLSSNHFNGTFVGTPKRVRSGAAIGDVSVHLYQSNWTGQTLTLSVDDQSVTVKNVSSQCKGLQVYAVKKTPSITTGIAIPPTNELYFGVFSAQQFPASNFSLESEATCDYFTREDNSSSPWVAKGNTGTIQRRIELIQSTGVLDFSLGDDRVICDDDHYEITTGLSDNDISIEWSNGATTPSIVVTESGNYAVTARSGCREKEDKISIAFSSMPQPFTLGEDVTTCDVKSIALSVPPSSAADIQWSDGSKGSSLVAKFHGKYWVSVKNGCGEFSDTINIMKPNIPESVIPNVMTPNSDGKNEAFVVREDIGDPIVLKVFNRWGELIYQDKSYNNNWSATDVSPGVYFITLSSPCFKFYKGTLHILE
jgi:hypothetical protein